MTRHLTIIALHTSERKASAMGRCSPLRVALAEVVRHWTQGPLGISSANTLMATLGAPEHSWETPRSQ